MERDDLAEYIEGNHTSLVSFVRRKLVETAERDSEDIVQDVLLGILDGPVITETIVNLSAYIFRALRNRIIDEYRKPRKTVHSMDEPVTEELTLKDILPDLKYEPRNSYRREKLRKEILEAVRSLPEKQREVIIETEFNGTRIGILAEKTKTPLGTILARKHRGLKTIQEKFNHIIKEDYHGTS